MWKDCLSLTFALITNIGCHFDSSGRGKCLIKPTICNFWLFTHSFLCCPVTFVGKIIFTTFPLPFNWHSSKKKSSSRASSKTTQGWKSSRTSPNLFHFQISLPTYFQECLRSIVVQYPCHKSLHLHFSKRLKSLLYFPASLTVLQSIQDVERRVN